MIFRFPQPGAADAAAAAGWWLAASAVAASSSLLSLLPPPRNAAAAASVQAYGGFVFVMAIPYWIRYFSNFCRPELLSLAHQ